jgi:hypothetical protein
MSDDLRLCPRCERAWIADRLDACTRCSPPLSTRGSPRLTAPVPGDGEDTTSVVVGTGEGAASRCVRVWGSVLPSGSGDGEDPRAECVGTG